MCRSLLTIARCLGAVEIYLLTFLCSRWFDAKKISLSLSLNLASMYRYSAQYRGGWSSLPGAEANGTLGTVPIGLYATLYTIRHTSFGCLWFS